MGGGWIWGVVLSVLAAGPAPGEALRPSLSARPSLQAFVPDAPLRLSFLQMRDAPISDSLGVRFEAMLSRPLGRGASVAYARAGQPATISLRAGYRFGLPLDDGFEANEGRLDSVVLSSGGTLSFSIGTVAWLQFDVESFREVAGARMTRLDAVPGVRVKLWRDLPLEAGTGLLVSLKRSAESTSFKRRFAALFQLLGAF